ncbi:MAG: NUDIX domain-containing protein [Bacteroidetes bacterium]|jgi:8-oxo-dGTP pyrophosphatase MutT (NUDIX family)|nr:NUDIX domain-containing protein [Bacteroidota bacterium]
MLLYYPAAVADVPTLARVGLHAEAGVTLYSALSDAEAAGEAVLVVNALQVPEAPSVPPAGPTVQVPRVSPAALSNVDPYAPPEPVTAAGGYVVRYEHGTTDLLLIYRRGVWDLPKGKADPGETPEACARREVCEEVGIDTLTLVRPLGRTKHGYREDGAYRVKTTHWFLMRTPERTFTPEAREQIQRVAWFPWKVAREKMGYETLRHHMDAIAGDVPGVGSAT